MSQIQSIRKRLGWSQSALAAVMGCSQSNVSFYERKGQTVPPDAAKRLIERAKEEGLAITYDHIYGCAELPPAPAQEPGHA